MARLELQGTISALVVGFLFAACGGEDSPSSAGPADAGSTFGQSACAACVGQSCGTERAACAAEPDCALWLQCLYDCATTPGGGLDPSCEAACKTPSAVTAAAAAGEFSTCRTAGAGATCPACGHSSDGGIDTGLEVLDQKCAPSTESDACYRCWDEKCCDSEAACNASTACKQMVKCVGGCSATDAACLEACFAVDAAAARLWAARLSCRFAYCATGATCFAEDSPDIDCDNQYCMKLRTACWVEPDCYAISWCVGGCGGSISCQEACTDAKPPAAQKAFSAYKSCVVANCL